jgi:hypothetical protein
VSIVQTLLVFVGIPALVFGLLAALVLAPGSARTPRYRPGEAWDYEPVWYVPQPERASQPAASGYAALEGGHRTPALSGQPPSAATPSAATPSAAAPSAESVAGARQADATRTAATHAEPGQPAPPARAAGGGVHDTW